MTDDDGTLVIVIADGPAGPALRALLSQLGCSQVIIPPKSLDLRLGGSLDLAGELAKTPLSGAIVTLDRAQAPAARALARPVPRADERSGGSLRLMLSYVVALLVYVLLHWALNGFLRLFAQRKSTI